MGRPPSADLGLTGRSSGTRGGGPAAAGLAAAGLAATPAGTLSGGPVRGSPGVRRFGTVGQGIAEIVTRNAEGAVHGAGAELAALAAAHGVETSYTDWRGRPATVPVTTIEAVLTALGADVSSPAAVRRELERSEHARRRGPDRTAPRPAAPARAPEPPGRAWGLMAQLYSVRSHGSWGIGDLADLRRLVSWSGGALGADFVLVNPLHAAEPAPPIRPSPYLPMSRRFGNPLYLRPEDVPEYATAGPDVRRRVEELAAPQRARSRTLDLIDRDAAWTAKGAALELLHRVPRSAAREAAYTAFRDREGAALTAFATWCALAEEHGADWRAWPAGLRDPASADVAAERERRAGRVGFHCWLQWQLDEQLAAVAGAAREAGMAVGVLHDLAVGVDPGGADAWAYQDLFASGMSVGAPPDEFNQRGQDWGQPPWHPGRLATAGYAPYRGMLRHVLRHAGGLRLDHAMQVFRLWWVPEGASPADGTYVSYPYEELLDVLLAEAGAAGAVVVGEDLGTVEGYMRDVFAERGVLGTSMAWFERAGNGAPLPPDEWRELCLATVGTHDMPPVAGYIHGDHIALRERLGLLTRPAADERADLAESLARWRASLALPGLYPPAPDGAGETTASAASTGGSAAAAGDALEMTVALHAFLARTPARLVGISLADAVGERRTQNQPGTTDEYPNWRVPLADGSGRPVLIEDLPADRRLQAAVAPVQALRR